MILIAVVAAAAYWLFSRDGFRRALEAQTTSWIGVPVRIGAARATFLPRIAVQLRDIRVGDPARLTLDTVDPKSGTSEFKATAVRIEKVANNESVEASK